MSVNPKKTIHVLTGDMVWLTTKVRFFFEIIKYYNQLIKMDHSRLTYKGFENDLQHISNENWSGDLETILNQIGMTENLFTGTEIDLDSAKKKLSVISDLDWQESITYKPKLQTYTNYKDHIGTEEYLIVNLPRLQRSLLEKLLSSTQQLAVEKGRYNKEELAKRVCFFTMKWKLRMKSIFLQCPRYQTYRDNFFTYICRNISKNFMNNNAVDTFIFIMKLNGKHIANFANYLVSSWEFRKSILYTSD